MKKNWFSSLKLKQKIRYLFLFIISIYLVFFLVMYSFLFSTNLTRYALENNRNALEAVGGNLLEELGSISNMSRLIMVNKDVVLFLKNHTFGGLRYSQNAVSAIFDIITAYDNIYSVFVFKLNGDYVHTGRDITLVNMGTLNDPKWLEEIDRKAGGYVLRLNGGGAFSMNTGEPILSFIRRIYDINTQELLGMVAVNIPARMLENTYKSVADGSRRFCYYDAYDHVLSRDDLKEEFKNLEISAKTTDQKAMRGLFSEEILSYRRIPDISLVIMSYEKIGYSEILTKETAWAVTGIVLITFFALTVIGAFISLYITHPIHKLVQSMGTVKSGLFRRVSMSLPDDEIGRLKDSYNAMMLEINDLIGKLIEKEKSVRTAELEVLQEQIKPHFLYNTIGTIGYLALENNAENVYDALETLGDFYRKFLSKGDKETTIGNEIGIVKDYLKLQKLRYEEVFEDQYEVCDDLLELKIPKLILQPLVENSLYHGIRPKGEKGIIRISVYSEPDTLHIVVYDDGIGMSRKQIDEIMETKSSKSFGFKGTMERVKYFCNREDVYEIRSVEGEFTEIDIRIPLEGSVAEKCTAS